jgi:hypothetical protein
MIDLVLIGAAGATGCGSLVLFKLAVRQKLQDSLVALRLSFPRNLEADAVVSAMAGWNQLLLPIWKRPFGHPFVSLEVHADASGIQHYVLTPEIWRDSVQNLLQASLPSVRYEEVARPDVVVRSAAEYRLTSHQRQLNIDGDGLSAKLLTNLQPLDEDESLVVQWIVTAHPPTKPPKVASKDDGPLALSMDSESVAALRKKLARPLLLATARIGTKAPTLWRELKLLRQVEGSWHETRAPGVHFTRRLLPESLVARRLRSRRPPLLGWPATLTDQELGAVSGWPIGLTALPGLVMGGCRLVPPSPLLPKSGNVIADSLYPGDSRPMALDADAITRPTLILGPTGVGKSTCMAALIRSDLSNGHGVLVIDPKADLCSTVMDYVPDNRLDEIIVFDPNEARCPGLNPLFAVGVDPEICVSNFVGCLRSINPSWGPRMEYILTGAALTVAQAPGSSVADLIQILTDANFRRRTIGQLDDPLGLEQFWDFFENGLSDAERQVAIAPIINKLAPLTMQGRLRAIFGQGRPALDIGRVMAERKVLLCSLAEGSLGKAESELLGALLMASIWSATTGRTRLPQAERPLVRAYFDELSTLVTLPTPIGSVLQMARGLNLGLTVATQSTYPLGTDVRKAVLANCMTKVCFQLSADDARIMEKEMAGVLTADDLQGLGAYEVACQIYAAGSTQPVATGRTRSLGDPTSNASAIRSASNQRYGMDRSEVDAELMKRRSSGHSTAVRRRPRTETNR